MNLEVFNETEKAMIRGFLVEVQHFEEHNNTRGANECQLCPRMVRRLNNLQNKLKECAVTRKNDDDLIDWDTVIIEFLTVETYSEEIQQPSPKKAKLEVEKMKEEEMGSKIRKLVAERKAKKEADDFYNLDVDFDDDDQEESGEDQEDEEQEEDEEDEKDDAMDGVIEQDEKNEKIKEEEKEAEQENGQTKQAHISSKTK